MKGPEQDIGLQDLTGKESSLGSFNQSVKKGSIAVVSAKGGVGKTTTTLNLGAAIADLDIETVVMDMDFDTPNLPVELGYTATGENTLQSILTSDMEVDLLASINRVRENLGIVPASLKKGDVDWGEDDLDSFIDRLDKLVLIDTPPGVGDVQRKILRSVDSVLLIIEPTESAYIDGMKTLSLAQEEGTHVLGMVVNRVGNSSYELDLDDIIDSLQEVKLLGAIPEDERVKKTRKHQKPLIDINPYSPASIAFKRIASELTQTPYSEPAFHKKLIGKVRK